MKKCEVCKKKYLPSKYVKFQRNCSKECYDLAKYYGYYDLDGELKLTEKGLNKLKNV